MSPLRHAFARTACWATAFVAAGFVGRATILSDGVWGLVWPAAGVAMLWLATGSRRTWWYDAPVLALCAFGVNLVTGSAATAAVFLLANAVQVTLFLYLLRQWLPDVWGFGGRRPLERVDDLGRILLGAVIACGVASLIGTEGLRLLIGTGDVDSQLVWWGRNVVGLVVVGLVGLLAGPPLATKGGWRERLNALVVANTARGRSRLRTAEVAVHALVTSAVYAAVFGLSDGPALSFLLLAPTFWAGLRFSPLATTTHGLVCGTFTIWLTLAGRGPFLAISDIGTRAMVAQLFVGMMTVAGLALALRHSQERRVTAEMRSMMDGSRLVAVMASDLDGIVRVFGVGAERLLGYRAEDVVDRAGPILFHDLAEVEAVAAELGVEVDQVFPELARTDADARLWTLVRNDGGRVIVQLAVSALRDHSGKVTRILGVAIDATEMILDQRRLAGAQAQWEILMRNLPDMTVLTLDEDLRIGRVTGAGAAALGVAGMTGRRLAELMPAGDLAAARLMVDTALAGGESAVDFEFEAYGHPQHVVATPLPPMDGPREVLVVSRDVSRERAREKEREAFQRQLAHLADHDPLTGLANRRRFERELDHHLERFGDDARGAVVMLDLDHFKDVNDLLGHAAGDQLLASIAQAFGRTVQRCALAARIGGDEFAFLLPEADLTAAEQVAAELVTVVRTHVADLDGVRRRVTASVGAVLIDGRTAEDLLGAADAMLYDAKDAGRDQHAVLDPRKARRSHVGARLLWADRVEQALTRGDFELRLQPILDLGTGLISGAEALVRMRLGEEIITPDRFLRIAERTHAIVDVDRWVLREGIALLAELQERDPSFHLSLNLSARSVGDSAVERELMAALERTGADPQGLVLEITETAAVAHVHEARAFIERITPLGCRFALDDFGAGYGSFHYLKHLPFDIVKIDGEFVSECATDSADRAIISSVVSLAAELGKQTVAEFVADQETLEVVRSLGVDLAQGYHIGRPVTVPHFVASMLPTAMRRTAP